jgi:hypothetical protein
MPSHPACSHSFPYTTQSRNLLSPVPLPSMTIASIAVWLSGNRKGVCGPIPKPSPSEAARSNRTSPPSVKALSQLGLFVSPRLTSRGRAFGVFCFYGVEPARLLPRPCHARIMSHRDEHCGEGIRKFGSLTPDMDRDHLIVVLFVHSSDKTLIQTLASPPLQACQSKENLVANPRS